MIHLKLISCMLGHQVNHDKPHFSQTKKNTQKFTSKNSIKSTSGPLFANALSQTHGGWSYCKCPQLCQAALQFDLIHWGLAFRRGSESSGTWFKKRGWLIMKAQQTLYSYWFEKCCCLILLMEEILHQLIGSLSHFLQGLTHPGGAGFLPSTVCQWIHPSRK